MTPRAAAGLMLAALAVLAMSTPAVAQWYRYAFVDHLSAPAPAPKSATAAAAAVRDAIVAATLESDVRFLAAPERRGRLRGTAENAQARAYIVERLERAALQRLVRAADVR